MERNVCSSRILGCVVLGCRQRSPIFPFTPFPRLPRSTCFPVRRVCRPTRLRQRSNASKPGTNTAQRPTPTPTLNPRPRPIPRHPDTQTPQRNGEYRPTPQRPSESSGLGGVERIEGYGRGIRDMGTRRGIRQTAGAESRWADGISEHARGHEGRATRRGKGRK